MIFLYDLALLDPASGTVEMLTDDGTEKAMPCFSPDRKYLYYAAYSGGIGSIWRMEMQSRKTETIFIENGVTAYYPIAYGSNIYFTKWYSAENRCDQLMCFDGNAVTALPFDSASYDCSDACPAGGGMIYSSTQKGAYDLYYFDGTYSAPLTALNTAGNDLGAAFFPFVPGDVTADGRCSHDDAAALLDWLLTSPDAAVRNWQAGDPDGSGSLTAVDLTLLKQSLSAQAMPD